MMKMLRRFRGMSCEDALRFLQSYLDGELDEATAKEVASHLDVCERCDLESAVFKTIKVSLRNTKVDIDPEIMSRLERFAESVANGEADN